MAKFVSGVVNTGGVDLQISPRIAENIFNDPNVFCSGLGKIIHEKNLKQKIS
jgi:hypothetical protein